jgi:predicted anti-sigma-YlaC factor YlaD
MKNHEADCRACQEELAFAAGRHLVPPVLVNHLNRCPTCQSFAASVRELAHLVQLAQSDRVEPDSDLVIRAMERLKPVLAERSREGFRLRAGLALAGLVSLPVIVGLNGVLLWVVYTMLEVWLSQPVAVAAAYIVAASTLLGLSLTYGSLPIMANWGLKLRQTPGVSQALGAAANGSAE